MTGTPPSGTSDAPLARAGRRLRHRAAYLLFVLLLVFIIVMLPFAIHSLIADFRQLSTPNHTIAAIEGQAIDRGSVAFDLIGINEWEGAVTVRETAHQECTGPCRWRDR